MLQAAGLPFKITKVASGSGQTGRHTDHGMRADFAKLMPLESHQYYPVAGICARALLRPRCWQKSYDYQRGSHVQCT